MTAQEFERSSFPFAVCQSQVRAEVFAIVQRWPIALRVTHHGIQSNSVGETCILAQGCSRDYDKIRNLAIDVWPPHPDRLIDAVRIWKHLRALARILIRVPLLQEIFFSFPENSVAAWVRDGKVIYLTHSLGANPTMYELGYNDIVEIMDLFARVKATRAWISLPWELTASESTHNMKDNLPLVTDMIETRLSAGVWAMYNEHHEKEAAEQD